MLSAAFNPNFNLKDSSDISTLASLKSICSKYPGVTEVVLVLGETNKSAIRLPFKVDGSSSLIGKLVNLIGDDSVVVK